MEIHVEGGHSLVYGTKDKDREVIKVELTYLTDKGMGTIFKIIPTRLRDLKRGDLIAIKVGRTLKGRMYMYAGHTPYRLKKVTEHDTKSIHKKILSIQKTYSKYVTVERFLFKGVKPDEDIPKQSRIHRDKEQRRIKKNRKSTDVQNKHIRRKRRSTATI